MLQAKLSCLRFQLLVPHKKLLKLVIQALLAAHQICGQQVVSVNVAQLKA